jgi:type IV pilus assembly protein PilA
MNKKLNNKGFSLVELIIVIAIMAILVGVLAPQFIKYVERSRESTDLQNVEEVKTAVETYVADHGEDASLPSSIKITFTVGSSGYIKPDIDLTEYGIATTGIKTKSSKWVISGDYTYPTTGSAAYSWTYPTGSAVYFDVKGSSTGK